MPFKPEGRSAAGVMFALLAAAVLGGADSPAARFKDARGLVSVKLERAPEWRRVTLGREKPWYLAVGELVRTGRDGVAMVLKGERTYKIDQLTTFKVPPDSVKSGKPNEQLEVIGGKLLVYSRSLLFGFEVFTPTAVLGVEGTEFVLEVGPDGATTVSMLDGVVTVTSSEGLGSLTLRSGDRGLAEKGHPPRLLPKIDAVQAVQWTLYYPAVVAPGDIALSAAERALLAESFAAYREGNLAGAREKYPENYAPASPATHLYLAATLLAVGKVDEALAALAFLPGEAPERRAIERMLAAVLQREWRGAGEPRTASEWLAHSYYLQSRHQLEAAREAAHRAAEVAPDFGGAHVRVAELEFSFGRTAAAQAALTRALAFAPRHAQAHCVRGFLLSAESRLGEAGAAFDQAIELDGRLGDAWLGRGLVRFRTGDTDGGREDMHIAATTESNRSILRSYLGNAFSQAGNFPKARLELNRARELDANDPTPWLYSALQYQQDYRYGEAIADLNESLRLNDQRRVYRSVFLLDQDRAVRSANLARIYQNAGLAEVAVREAARAVESDYASSSAHLFLANSFDALRDPTRVNLRHETAWFNELLLASLLAPVGGGPLSQYVSQHEYSKLLQADGWRAHSITEWRGSGDIDQQLSLSFNRGRWGGGLDFAYHHDTGSRPDSGYTRRELFAQLKFQPAEDDILYLLTNWQHSRNGDVFENYANLPGKAGLRQTDKELPALALLGWNHRWAPGHHTLLIASRLGGVQDLSAPDTTQLLLRRDPAALQPDFLRRSATGALEYSSAELRGARTCTCVARRGRRAGFFPSLSVRHRAFPRWRSCHPLQ